MAEETETREAPAKRAMGGAVPAKRPIKCGYRNCKFKSIYATVVGLHRSRFHGIKGQSPAAKYLRKTKKAEICPECGEGPLKALADHMRKVHGIFKRKVGRPAKHEEITLNGNSNASHTNEEALSFWLGRATAQAEQIWIAYAERIGASPEEFTARCLGILSGGSKTLREKYRLPHSM